jgi:small subunit ribosomal protein S6
MRPYEAMVILESSVDDAAIEANVSRVKDLVTAKSGTVGQVEKWGRRRFAYELKHRWEGNYTVIQLNAGPDTVAELDRMFTLSDDVLRHKIVRLPDSFVGGKPPAKPSPTTAPESESRNK